MFRVCLGLLCFSVCKVHLPVGRLNYLFFGCFAITVLYRFWMFISSPTCRLSLCSAVSFVGEIFSLIQSQEPVLAIIS